MNAHLAPRLHVADLGWLAWIAVAFWSLHTSASPWTPACVLVASVAVWWTRGAARAGLGSPVLAVASVVAAAWVVLTVAVGPGSGGDVLWVLPEWSVASGTPVGGPLTTGRLRTGLALAASALAHLALLALVVRCVSGERLARLHDVVLGHAARFTHPLCFAAEELARIERARPALAAHGLGRLATPLPGVVASAHERAVQWQSVGIVEEGAAKTRVRVLLVLAVSVAALAAAVGRILTGVEASLLGVLVPTVAGMVLSRARVVTRHAADLAPLACAALTLVLVVLEVDPTFGALSLLVLPVFTTAVPENPRREVGR
ncbi:hypothetical protein GHK92_15615 [Nocardioides sp. dk4132]|uniref:hypothetical protein n=1 Tax=unclassified Nocardioides TaxID=2615069 RepID=UPI0012969699|nr:MULTISPECIES: hypothetical protein [unclassified Nocardioides]MQW77301.1 hypothetical protein [Nocardioides sp. dk4132]QGA08055.1 hypothetical protein GFH29_12090 [Nocardioides sp. dk884]